MTVALEFWRTGGATTGRHNGMGMLAVSALAMPLGAVGMGALVMAAFAPWTAMAPVVAALAGFAVYFTIAHRLVHGRRRLDPMVLLKAHFALLWAMLGLPALVASATGAVPVPALPAVLAAGVVAAVLTAVPALAAGDAPPAGN